MGVLAAAVVADTDPRKRTSEAMWNIQQINNQRSCVGCSGNAARVGVLQLSHGRALRVCGVRRYVFDMFKRYNRISRQLYQFCLDNVRRQYNTLCERPL